jgi:pyruvate-ferredoxin/flavodoxin oxidoreductase
MKRRMATIDGNEAAAWVAYRASEVIAIYPITPSSGMGELADAWSSTGKKNIWGAVPQVVEMQSEGGAAGALHGALQAGSLTTTFTASQGLLLMIPNMYKIAGELHPFVMHVSARALATHALSIFGDHSDVMAARATGFAMLCAGSVQEVMDLALVSHAAALRARVPFVHFFDGFRTSHEIAKIEELNEEDMRALLGDQLVLEHRRRRLTPDRPAIRGTAQNPDVYFQGREAANPYYQALPGIVQEAMDQLAARTGRQYRLFDYAGAADAERVIVIMGSGGETVQETVEALGEQGEKVGVLKVRLFHPFSVAHFAAALPASAKRLAVLDRTKEPGSVGEPLYQTVVAALDEADRSARVIGGRYGLGSKEFTPAMVKAVFDELKKEPPKRHFTVGIVDDLSHTHLELDPAFSTERDEVTRALFYGLGSDGTVGANHNSIRIIGEGTDNYAQGYFVYDSKKSGSVTVSHLRFGKKPIRSAYLIERANFVACHQAVFLERYDMLAKAVEGATFLLNTPIPAEQVWGSLPRPVQQRLIEKQIKFYAIDAYKVAREAGMGGRINTVMQTCFFAISGVMPAEQAIGAIKEAIQKTYGKRGEEVVRRNFAAVDQALAGLHQIPVPGQVGSALELPPVVPAAAPRFVQEVLAPLIAGQGDQMPVSCLPVDGTFPTGTTQWEKRNISLEIPVWDPQVCIQCNKCVLVCPHAVIRAKVYTADQLEKAPAAFKSTAMKGRDFPEDARYTLQVAPEDCTGCNLCVEVCPARNKTETRLKAINMAPQPPLRASEKANWEFFEQIPDYDRRLLKLNAVKGSQFLRPLFEFSGACAGCGETPYLKLLSQLFGDRTLIANATGCSSIYGGNLPTTPWTTDAEGRGPAWANSLFEDNAEFGLGMRMALDQQGATARQLLGELAPQVGEELATQLLNAEQGDEAGIHEQRQRVAALKEKLADLNSPQARHLESLAEALVKKDVWIVGGDGWAYDIGFGGLDHVLASGRNVNILVLDTEVYSNTGGQMSKSTPRGAVSKFAAAGKQVRKKDLAQIAMSYGNVYVAQVAMGAGDAQTVRAFLEAETYEGVSLIIAYSHCIAHGIDMKAGMEQQKAAADCGHWPLFRYHPEHPQPLSLDTKAPKIAFKDYAYQEARYNMLAKSHPQEAARLLEEAQADVVERWRFYEQLAAIGHGESPTDGEEK